MSRHLVVNLLGKRCFQGKYLHDVLLTSGERLHGTRAGRKKISIPRTAIANLPKVHTASYPKALLDRQNLKCLDKLQCYCSVLSTLLRT